MENKDIIQSTITVGMGVLVMVVNYFLNKKDNEEFRIRKEKEKELINDIFINYHYSSFNINFDGFDFIDNTNDKFDLLERKVQVYINKKYLKELQDTLFEYKQAIEEYLTAKWNLPDDVTTDPENNRILTETELVYKNKKSNVKKKLESLDKVLNKILYS